MTTSTKFELQFFRVFLKNSLYLFSRETLALLPLLEEVKPSPDCKTIKLRTFDNLFPPLRHSR